MKRENEFYHYSPHKGACVDPDFEHMWKEEFKAPREIKFERDIFEIIENLN